MMFSDLYVAGRDLWDIYEWVREQADKPTARDIERGEADESPPSYQQSYDEWITADESAKWSETIRHTKETLVAFWQAFDDATEAINTVKEIRPSADPSDRWKAQAVLLLLKVGNSFMRFNDAGGGAVEFVCHWRLPAEWVDWLNQLHGLEAELRAVKLADKMDAQVTDDDKHKPNPTSEHKQNQADSGQQNGQSKKIVPDNPEVAKLALKIRREREKVPHIIDIARDFTNGNDKLAKSLLRQLRRYPHLIE